MIYGAAIGGWGCCGRRVYLLSRDLCCSGTVYNVQYVETSRKQCCGTELLDPRDGICCDNVTLVGEVLCPGIDAQNKRKWLCSVSLHILYRTHVDMSFKKRPVKVKTFPLNLSQSPTA